MLTYLDHGATTPVLPAALEAYTQVLGRVGNPSSLHTAGRDARRVVEESREQIAALVGAAPSEVIFTSGGTEADNIAVVGTHRARVGADPTRRRVLVPRSEHHAVLDSAEQLAAHEGARATWIDVDPQCRVTPDALRAALGDGHDVSVVSVMWANNEVGTISPLPELAAVAAEHGVPLHTDAVQAVGHVPVSFADSGASALTLTGHKLGAPVGTGALLLRRDAAVTPLSYGGGQERAVRSGTLDAAGARALAVALDAAVAELDDEAARLAALRDRLLHGALALDGIRVGGAWTPGSWHDRLPGNAHLVIDGAEGDSLLYLLDAAGIACSTGSACQAGVPQPSHVLLAMGLTADEARGALRFTLGRTSTDADVDAALAALPGAVARARRASA